MITLKWQMAKRGIKSKNNYAANDIIKCQMSCLKNSCVVGAALARPTNYPRTQGNPPSWMRKERERERKKKQQETTKCKAASNLFKAIFQFIEVESIRNKKPPKRTENRLRAILVAAKTRAAPQALSATWLMARAAATAVVATDTHPHRTNRTLSWPQSTQTPVAAPAPTPAPAWQPNLTSCPSVSIVHSSISQIKI